MTKAEAECVLLLVAPQSREHLGQLLSRQAKLQESLEQQQSTVSSISHFIVADSEDTSGLEEELAQLGGSWASLW